MIEAITREFLVRTGMASRAPRSEAMSLLIARFIVDGIYTTATEDEIEEFAAILEDMEEV